MQRSQPNDVWLEIGVVAKPHGLGGGLTFKSYSGNLEALAVGRTVRLKLTGGQERDFKVASVRPFKAGGIIQFAGISLDQAAPLRGAKLLVQRADLGPLAVGEVFVADLIGLQVLMPDGQLAGVVKDAVDTRPLTLIVEGQFSGTVPFHQEWLQEPDFAAGCIRLRHPPIA